jgi:UDP-glucose-4-epimerase GalE
VSVVLVTGGAGYVGSHAVKALAAAGHDVVVYDDLSAGHAEAVERIASAYPERQIRLVRGDIADLAKVRHTLQESGAAAVMHFAARLLVGESVSEPFLYYRVNVGGALSVLAGHGEAGVKAFVFSSTAATFGEPQAIPIDESHPQRPINPYGESKLAVERALGHVERAFGIRSIALRYFNAAGADESGLIGEDHHPEEHLIPLAVAAVRGGPPLTVFGDDWDTPDGTCIRDYIHVADLSDAHVASLAACSMAGLRGSSTLATATGCRFVKSSTRSGVSLARRFRTASGRGVQEIRLVLSRPTRARVRNSAGRRASRASTRSSEPRGSGTSACRRVIRAKLRARWTSSSGCSSTQSPIRAESRSRSPRWWFMPLDPRASRSW